MSGQHNELTSQEEAFVSAYIRRGFKDAASAAIEAEYSAHTAAAQASRLLKRVKVKKRIEEARRALKRDTEFSVKTYTKELEDMRDKAETAGVYGAAVKALELIGRVHGVYVEKHQDISADMEDLKRDLLIDTGSDAVAIINHIFAGNPADNNTMRKLFMSLMHPQNETDEGTQH